MKKKKSKVPGYNILENIEEKIMIKREENRWWTL